jgi:anti-sigma factor RsiW
MNSCRKNRKRLALLAVSALGAKETSRLQEHLEHCQVCREYSAGLEAVTGRLADSRAKLQSAPAQETWKGFHARLMSRIRSTARAPLHERLLAWLQNVGVERRVAFGAGLMALLVLLMWLTQLTPHASRQPELVRRSPASPAGRTEKQIEPSASSYLLAASKSLDQFDELLARQANGGESDRTIYCAALWKVNSDSLP